MTYFEHTKRDLAEARKELGELVLALADDTVRKMNGELPGNPEAEHEYDRTYLLEDLLTRLSELVETEARVDLDLFPNVGESIRVRPAYPLLDNEIEGEVVTNEIGAGEATQEIGVALYSSRNAKTSRHGVASQGITRVEEGGAYKR